VLNLWYKNLRTAALRLARIERFTNGVRCMAFIVENAMEIYIDIFGY